MGEALNSFLKSEPFKTKLKTKIEKIKIVRWSITHFYDDLTTAPPYFFLGLSSYYPKLLAQSKTSFLFKVLLRDRSAVE